MWWKGSAHIRRVTSSRRWASSPPTLWPGVDGPTIIDSRNAARCQAGGAAVRQVRSRSSVRVNRARGRVMPPRTAAMVPLGESYRPDGSFGVRTILVTLILGLTAAVLSAGAVWLWEISPFPTIAIVTSVLQGAAVGGGMAMLVARFKRMRSVVPGTGTLQRAGRGSPATGRRPPRQFSEVGGRPAGKRDHEPGRRYGDALASLLSPLRPELCRRDVACAYRQRRQADNDTAQCAGVSRNGRSVPDFRDGDERAERECGAHLSEFAGITTR